MHPILMAELANDRHAELVRNAEARRSAARVGRSRTLLASAADSLTSAAGRLRRPAVVAGWSAPAEACCA